MTPERIDQLPYSILQRPDGLWSLYDATGREVEGVARPTREEVEHTQRVIERFRAGPGKPIIIHMIERK